MRNIYMYKLACNDVVPTDIRGNVYIRCQSGKLYVVGVAYIYGRNICTWIPGQLPAGIYGTWTGKGKSCYGIFTLPLLLSDKVFAVFLAEPVSDIIAAIVTTTVFMAKFNGILEHKK